MFCINSLSEIYYLKLSPLVTCTYMSDSFPYYLRLLSCVYAKLHDCNLRYDRLSVDLEPFFMEY